VLDAWPAWAKWLAAFAAMLSFSALAGFVTPLGVGNAVFLAGAACILGSLLFIRLGGPKALVGRELKGKPVFGFDSAARREELRRGVGLFLLGAAMWAILVAVTFWPA
jgi:hypothetical protein